ncbi:S8 family serine peptidase [Deinococcus sp. HMF7604]|uniref:S8 family serine peptidase n=1 Tax=Deinococcus betulae TaxID=2873312 RepID=UPI001CCF00C4|nr:S8 family serine peptidase [Deinococcus betulae]MBZ9750343.1 S8 family serine peptidase [Deinococcus betulae]
MNFKGGNGKGVTIHILDTASGPGRADPFVMAEPVNYYNEIYKGRPYHGSVAGMIAGTLAPNAAISYKPVCDRDGQCSTLKTAQALCAVVAEAKRSGRHVVNLSVGGPYPTVGLQLALREVAAAGVPTAAAYGNRDDCAGLVKGDRCHHFPADWSSEFQLAAARPAGTMLYSVAGWDIATKQMATYNRGVGNPGVTTLPPSVQAPGEFWMGGLPYFGSSFAAPVVSGVLANWMSCRAGVPLLPLLNTPGQLPLPLAILSACP